jgi:hypothetical protein
MVTPTSSSILTDGLAIYQHVLRRASDVFTAIIALYRPDIRAPRDWPDITVSEATTQLNGLQERLLTTTFKAVSTMTLVSTIGHYLDTHWADYERIMPDHAKRQQVEQLHATLEALMKEIEPINLALWQHERGQIIT